MGTFVGGTVNDVVLVSPGSCTLGGRTEDWPPVLVIALDTVLRGVLGVGRVRSPGAGGSED